MVNSIHTGGRKGSLILSNNRAIVLHQGGQCGWAGGDEGMVDSCTTLDVKEYLVKAKLQ